MDCRYLVHTQGQTHPTPAKMAATLLRYKPELVVALLDSENAGRNAIELMNVGKDIPIVASIAESMQFKPNTLVLGITHAGGQLPADWRSIILEAIYAGLDVISGLHTFLNEDDEFVKAAKKYRVNLIDLRKPPENLSVNKCRARHTHSLRIHTVGTDCNCGKKVVAIEIDRVLREAGKKSTFIATGQSGILITGKGIALDRVVSDFVAGAAEHLILENEDYDYLLIEGQGALTHPLYSGVTLSMLHGFMPQALILCHQPERKILRGTPDIPVPQINKVIDLYERIAEPVHKTKVIGIALNLMAYSDDEAKELIPQFELKTGLPVTDVIRFGTEKLLKAIFDFETKLKQEK